jgi:DNA polymerase-3 subunit epsilon
MSILILDTSTRWGVHDIETTGLTDADRIVQFGCCFFQGRHKSDEVELLLNPGIPIPEQVSQLHGITTAMVADKPTMALVGQRIHAALTDRQMAVAFNGRRFDDQWLMRELAGAGIENLICSENYFLLRTHVLTFYRKN